MHPDANKIQIKQAVETVFQGEGRGGSHQPDVPANCAAAARFTGYASDWKKAYVRLQTGQKIPEYAEI